MEGGPSSYRRRSEPSAGGPSAATPTSGHVTTAHNAVVAQKKVVADMEARLETLTSGVEAYKRRIAERAILAGLPAKLTTAQDNLVKANAAVSAQQTELTRLLAQQTAAKAAANQALLPSRPRSLSSTRISAGSSPLSMNTQIVAKKGQTVGLEGQVNPCWTSSTRLTGHLQHGDEAGRLAGAAHEPRQAGRRRPGDAEQPASPEGHQRHRDRRANRHHERARGQARWGRGPDDRHQLHITITITITKGDRA
jgi:hypothetical protein